MTKKPTSLDTHHDGEGATDASMRLAAVYVNSFRLRVGLDLTRLSFAETDAAEGDAHYRVALVMPTSDALNLAATLHSLADRLQAQLSAATAAGVHGEKPN